MHVGVRNESIDESHNQLLWSDILAAERSQPYFQDIIRTIEAERASGQLVYPTNANIFSCFKMTEFNQVKVVILGQDPYHGPGQAHGLSFSVPRGVVIPPSLNNIFKELVEDVGVAKPTHGNLESWAEQGVFLLNAVLSVQAGRAGSHASLGWERFTDAVISALSDKSNNLVFILWGSYAAKKQSIIDTKKHCVLTSVHPSPLSAHRGFFGSKPFSRANSYLQSVSKRPIDWSL